MSTSPGAGLLIGGLSIANYLFYYARNGVDPFTGAGPAAILAPAMSVSYVTVMVCQLVSIIQRRSTAAPTLGQKR